MYVERFVLVKDIVLVLRIWCETLWATIHQFQANSILAESHTNRTTITKEIIIVIIFLAKEIVI